MDLTLTYNPALQGFDLALNGADFLAEDTLASAVLVALLSDRLAASYEVPVGYDRRGWWADSLDEGNYLTGSRLWLLAREKQLPGVLVRCKQYCEEALQYLVDDGIVTSVLVTVFNARPGWLVALIKLAVNTGSRIYRFEFDEERQLWRLAGEAS